MIGIYERSLCQSYASAYRAGIKIGEAETREDALKQVEAMTEDSYQCFAVDDDGTCIDLTGTFPGCLAGGDGMSCEYCEEGRTLFASAEGRACDIDDISVERLCVLGKEGPAKEPYVIGISLYNGDYCYTKDISYCPMCGAKLGGDGA